jgi:hypothetical protein
VRARYSEAVGNFPLRSGGASDRDYIVLRQDGPSVFVATAGSSFDDHVLRIILRCAEKQVLRINA